jgi:hypothetical protein
MLTISRQDVFKTLIIIWFIGTTGYFIYDIYINYRVRGMQMAYNDGYGASVNDLIKKATSNKCQPFEVQKDGTKLQLIDISCLQQQNQAIKDPTPTSTTNNSTIK